MFSSIAGKHNPRSLRGTAKTQARTCEKRMKPRPKNKKPRKF
ncbi:hypothetical protein BRPE64_ACDS05880 [Caballeronia insecticola]|uniref:Uncharacterized protein n=1 Tax=Caballeronia insecticola TaxID=758793 RepID=R4WWS8_9BURK|nr:hypothetical protein BRPE64_ACDS05880 [Caballeronia insecticola]